MHLCSKLKKVREEKRISQQEVANFLNISQKTYSNIESGKSEISCEYLYRLSKFLDFDLFEILQQRCFILQQKRVLTLSKDTINNNGDYLKNLIVQYEARINELLEINSLLKEKITKI